MHIRITNRHVVSLLKCFLPVFLLAFVLIQDGTAQEFSTTDEVNKIEVKDGKVYINGEMVKELEHADRPIFFSGNSDGEHSNMGFFSSDNSRGNVFAFSKTSGFGPKMSLEGEHGRRMEFLNNDRKFRIPGDAAEVGSSYNFARGFSPSADFMWREAGPQNLFFSQRGDSEEIRNLEMTSHELARSLRMASDEVKTALEEELNDVLNQIFDLKEESMNERLTKMSGELNKLRGRVAERKNSKSDIILRRYRELAGEKDSLSW